MVRSKRISNKKFVIQWFGKFHDERPRKFRRIRGIHEASHSIINLPSDCLGHIFKRIGDENDRKSFGLTCRQFFHIHNINREHLWFLRRVKKCAVTRKPSIDPKSFTNVLCKLLDRFPHLKHLSLSGLPTITDFAPLTSHFYGSKVQSLNLDSCKYSHIKFYIIFSWFPSLTDVSLIYSNITNEGLEALSECCSSLKKVNFSNCQSITDKGLEALAKRCSSLKNVDLSYCQKITDSGISSLTQNIRELDSLSIECCSRITGTGFLGCAQTLRHLTAGGCKLKPEGINAIISGRGLESLILSTVDELGKAEEGSTSTEEVVDISEGCPLLKKLVLPNCEDVEQEGWEAIGLNCKNLEHLILNGCQNLCQIGLQDLYNGCDNLSILEVHDKIRCSQAALERFRRHRPDVKLYEKIAGKYVTKE